ncbi:uncharacterized protein LOC111080162 isoform X1 [Drosophila obscura]|uniref:uncharacterized protein LOC111080162 isoform X1 n=1 Tax=Drosophila obscura TaxID=7282 RepID=UPI001BB2C8E0|nr:uncharacterized protein LOC111080162 isoform X1 [Drosophila obscura]
MLCGRNMCFLLWIIGHFGEGLLSGYSIKDPPMRQPLTAFCLFLFCFKVYEGFKPFIVVGLSAWLPILLAATLLLVGASQEMFVLLLTAIVLAMFGGCLWITSSLGMLIDTWGMDKLFLIDSVLGIIAICLFLGLIGLFVYFTCRFMRELQR